MMKHFCKRCFFAELDPNGIYREISDLIAALPDEKRTEEKEYRRRLELCGEYFR